MAALKGDELCVRALLAARIDVNQKNKKDETALMNAAFGGHMDVVRALLAAKADPMIKTDSGKTADMLAKNDKIRDVLFAEICTRGSCVGGAGAASGSVANTIDAQAIVELGVLYHAGQGVLRDYGRARELYEQAAAQGHARAQTNLGLLYQRGLGVPKDYVRAREWYEKAAAQGFAEAQNNLGWLYADQGVLEGILRDYRRAREFFEQAAAQGHAGAQYGLGWSHELVLGCHIIVDSRENGMRRRLHRVLLRLSSVLVFCIKWLMEGHAISGAREICMSKQPHRGMLVHGVIFGKWVAMFVHVRFYKLYGLLRALSRRSGYGPPAVVTW